MQLRAVLLLAVAAACVTAIPRVTMAAKDAPKWPTMYEVSFNLTVPYINKLQQGGLTYTYQFWRDEVNGRQKMVRDGIETTIIDLGEMMRYDVFPARDHLACWTDKIGGKSGPTLSQPRSQAPAPPTPRPDEQSAANGPPPQPQQSQGGGAEKAQEARRRLLSDQQQQQQQQQKGQEEGAAVTDIPPGFPPEDLKLLGFLLPDLSEERWQLNGTVKEQDGRQLTRYTYLLRKDMGYGDVHGQYDFLVDESGAPAALRMWGINLYTNGHFDDYQIIFHKFDAHTIPEQAFAFDKAECTPPPALLQYQGDGSVPFHLPGTAAAHVASLLPSVHHGDPEYDVFAHHSGRRHATRGDYDARRKVFYDNKRFIEDWNAGNHSHTCAMNRFGDWSTEERRALFRRSADLDLELLGIDDVTTQQQGGGRDDNHHNRKRKEKKKHYRHMKPHRQTLPYHFLPKVVDWRGTPADSPVKDQAACGSCWAFSTIQSLESAYYRSTGKAMLLSEQHLLDCAWNWPTMKSCFGGDQDMALEYAIGAGFIASEESMPYLGVNQFCPKRADGIKFRGHWHMVPPGEDAVKEALATVGPLTVSIDASQPDMSFYSSGIYYNKKCQDTADGLDHAVMLSGYGEDADGGRPYWIVKNTWSTYWGEEGYIRVAREPDDCGIAAETMYATFQKAEEVKGHKLK